MPVNIARFYDWMDALGNYDYGVMLDEDLQANLDMYYGIVKEEFPEQFAQLFA